MKSAARQNVGFTGRYFRRILGLLILGFFNIAFLFQGDILVLYAILGSLLFLFRRSSVQTLMRWGVGFYILQVAVFSMTTLGVYMGYKYTPDDMALELMKITDAVAQSHDLYGIGTFVETVGLRLREWSEIIQFGIFMDGPGAMAFFLFGLAAVKSDTISNPNHTIWKRFRSQFLPIGIIGSLIGAYIQSLGEVMLSPASILGTSLIAVFAPFFSAGYLGLIAKWASGPITRLKIFLARGGTASLTAYLLQGLFLSLIFNAYGLGFFAKLDAIYCIGTALAVQLAHNKLCQSLAAKVCTGTV